MLLTASPARCASLMGVQSAITRMREFAVLLSGVDRMAPRRASHAPLVRPGESTTRSTPSSCSSTTPVEEQLEEPNGVALVFKELRQGPLYHRVGADDGYRGCGLVLSHLLAVAPLAYALAYEKRAGALRPRPPSGCSLLYPTVTLELRGTHLLETVWYIQKKGPGC